MKRISNLLFLIIIVFQSCNTGTHQSWKNENIDPQITLDITQLNKRIINSLINNDIKQFKQIASKGLIEESGDKLDNIIKQINRDVKNPSYRVLDNYYTLNTTVNLPNTLISGFSGDSNYVIFYQARDKEMFVSLLIVKDEFGEEYLISNFYGKKDDGWKLNIFQFGQYSLRGLNAIDYYKIAKDKYELGYLIDAALNMSLAGFCLKPANQLWQYDKEQELIEFSDKVMQEVQNKYNFPLTINEVDTKPQILGIKTWGIEKGIFPLISYMTIIPLKDTASLRTENNQIDAIIGHLFKGIDKGKSTILYRAYNIIPTDNTPVESLGFVVKQNTN